MVATRLSKISPD